MEHEKKILIQAFESIRNNFKFTNVNESLGEVAGSNDASTTMEPSCLKCSLKGALMQTFPDRYQGTLIFHQ